MYTKLKIMLILMWRHILVRKHKFIWTILEIFSTVAVFVTMYLSRQDLRKSETPGMANLIEPLSIPMSIIPGPSKVLYTPENYETSTLMRDVSLELDITVEPFTVLPENLRSGDNLDPNITIGNNLNNIFKTIAVVKFKDLNYFQRRLEYTISMVDNHGFRMSLTNRRLYSEAEPFFKPTLPLQWTIDKLFIQRLTGETIEQDVYLQEFPRLKSHSVPNIFLISMFLYGANLIGLFIPFIFIGSRLLEERLSGVMELINMAGASRIMLIYSHFLNGIPSCLLFSFGGSLCLKRGQILPESDGLLIFLIFLLHSMSIIVTAMLTSFVTNRTQYGTACITILYVLFDSIVELANPYVKTSVIMNYALGILLPKRPLFSFLQELYKCEETGRGITWSTVFSKQFGNVPVISYYIMLLLQIVLYFILVMYLTSVRPGPYGTAKPWNFPFKKYTVWVDTGEANYRDPKYFENAPQDKEVGVRVINVSKAYNQSVVVDNVSMDIYKGDITVLLGHNGAGKTTLMNVITGMTSATAGEVQVNGEKSTQEVRRREMGLCPQHNVFLPSLTIYEHVVFFAMLKGHSYLVAKYSSSVLLEELGLLNKANMTSNQLSGGMKRRLQLACALSGDTSVLVLDEPTSGLDVETRRELWNLLLKLRRSRTTLLSTHFMEEADALGDRIAALSEGQLVCYATPIVLKTNIGTGYILTISTVGEPNEPEITKTVLEYLPEATLRESAPSLVTYNLPTRLSSRFPRLFMTLEHQREHLKINTIGVGMSSLEEVFHKLCCNVAYETEEAAKKTSATTFKLIRPPLLYLRQMAALFKRLVMYIWSTKFYFLLVNTLLPLSVIYLFTTQELQSESSKKTRAEYIRFFDPVYYRVYFEIDNDTNIIEKLSKTFKHAKFQLASNITAEMIKSTEAMSDLYKTALAAIKIDPAIIQIFYTPHVTHAAGDALNLASIVISSRLTHRGGDESENFTITTYNQDPITEDVKADLDEQTIVLIAFTILKTVFILLIYFATMVSVDELLSQELLENTRWLHIMAGCPVILHWITRLFFHIIQYTLLLIIPTIIMMYLFDNTEVYRNEEVLGIFALILFLGLISWLSFIYLMSFSSLGPLILYVCCIVGVIIGLFDSLSQTGIRKKTYLVSRIIYFVSWLFLPPDVGCVACMKTINIALRNKLLNGTESIFEFADGKPLYDMCYLLVQFICQMALVICIEEGCGLFNLYYYLLGRIHKSVPMPRYNDKSTTDEAQYVKHEIANAKTNKPDVMLVHTLYKTYYKRLCQPVHAVNGISFSVKKGECFGLLGVNGAGKSTTFSMITAQAHITRGKIWANGIFLKTPRGKYLKSLSYCPQFLGVDSFLSPRQNLSLLLKIRGLLNKDIKHESTLWLEIVGLEKLRNLPVSALSGGCKRRTSTACALCSAAPLTLLDEPTSGVDVSARRRVWYAVRRALRAEQAVVITSHSMDEMEALCGRVGIMKSGEMCALGTVPALRSQHAAGFSLTIKISTVSDAKQYEGYLNELKDDLTQTFVCTLKDEHGTMLHYHIDENMLYSLLFTKLEDLKSRHGNFIENYTVSETTLEEVFLSFAHKRGQYRISGIENV